MPATYATWRDRYKALEQENQKLKAELALRPENEAKLLRRLNTIEPRYHELCVRYVNRVLGDM